MNYSEDHIALAAEYALGTLDADERALVETMMIVDHGFMEVVDAWDRKLVPLHQMVAAVEPPPHLWNNIQSVVAEINRSTPMPPEPEQPPAPIVTSEAAGVVAPAPEPAAEQPSEPPAVAAPSDEAGAVGTTPEEANATIKELEAMTAGAPPDVAPEPVVAPRVSEQTSNVVELADRKRGGFGFGMLMSAVAAALASVIALQAYRPDLLPEGLRVKPKVQIVEVPAPPAPQAAQFVALLQQDASTPAFILTVDTKAKTFTVRKLGATSQPGKSYELWLVSDRLQRPWSLGVIGGADFTIRASTTSYDPDMIRKATYAVTIEPEGGSPTGIPTGQIVYTGKLIETVPSLPPR
ncbi:anti-sigma factor [Bradyrhizobium sp. SYSU BS000235]|uniref:anti-sigma factor n=1 Tax=Bradyrhizobium sp. SYSU BS000235 TaxID=3411332 RepID=UPI003C7908EE